MKNTYETFSDAVNDLLERGYSANFSFYQPSSKFRHHEHSVNLPPHDFVVDEVHHFDGNGASEDEMIVFAISSRKYGVKGIVFNAFANHPEPDNHLEIIFKLKRLLKYFLDFKIKN